MLLLGISVSLLIISGRLEVEKRVLSEQLRSQLYDGIPIEQDVYDLLADLKDFPQVIELARQLLPAETPSQITENSPVDREYLHAGLSPYIRCKKYRGHLKKQAENLAEAVQSVQDMFNKTLTVAVCSDQGCKVNRTCRATTKHPPWVHLLKVGMHDSSSESSGRGPTYFPTEPTAPNCHKWWVPLHSTHPTKFCG